MPSRNLRLLVAMSVVSLACLWNARHSPYAATYVQVLDAINQRYIEPTDKQQMLEAALRGMTSRLDRYSTYIPPRSFRDLRQSLEQHFAGIGIQLSLDPDTKQLTVLTPIVGSPAHQAGVLAGDRIVKINGQSTAGFSIDQAAERLKGPRGEPVAVTVVHAGQTEPVNISIVRDDIEIDSVLGDTRQSDDRWNFVLAEHPTIGYARVVSFSERTVAELRAALESFAQRDVTGLVLDLRNDPGGMFDSAVDVCDLFLPADKLIVSTRPRDPKRQRKYFSTGAGPYFDLPIVILVNQYTASASEIVAACLQDHGRAQVVGQRTWGKGSVQHVLNLEGGRSALKLTIATYWRPSGRNIHRLHPDDPESQPWGVMPDPGCDVPLDAEAFERVVRARNLRDIVRSAGGAGGAEALPPGLAAFAADAARDPVEVDPQLGKAFELLSASPAQRAARDAEAAVAP
ncbi:MAG: S41 family peptidase [Pirellulales bacterium]|nr:S41 family peptidase [Pirellulales bacterium]